MRAKSLFEMTPAQSWHPLNHPLAGDGKQQCRKCRSPRVALPAYNGGSFDCLDCGHWWPQTAKQAEYMRTHPPGYYDPKTLRNKKIGEGRDDTSKLGLGKAGMAYAKMTSKDVMEQPGGVAKKVQKRYDMVKSVTNQKGIKGFPSMDKAGKVPSAIKDSMEIVRQLLDA